MEDEDNYLSLSIDDRLAHKVSRVLSQHLNRGIVVESAPKCI